MFYRSLPILFSLFVLVLLFLLMRSKRLKERYVWMWAVLAVVLVFISIFPRPVILFSKFIGFETTSNMLFSGMFVLLLLVCLHLAMVLSTHEENRRALVEEIAICKAEITQLQADLAKHVDGGSDLECGGVAGQDTGDKNVIS